MNRGAVAFAVVMMAVAGCSPPTTRTTFLESVDLVDMTDSMAESFAGDPVISRRTQASGRWVISIDQVANRTYQLMPSREKWLYTTRLRALLAESGFAGGRNIVLVVHRVVADGLQPNAILRPDPHIARPD